MITMIMGGGESKRFTIQGVCKPLLQVNKKTITGRIIEKVPKPVYINTTNGLSNKFKALGNKVKIISFDKAGGCLADLQKAIDCGINDDLLVVVGSIVFDFSLEKVMDRFRETHEVCLPIMKLPDGSKALRLPHSDYYELGIYLIPKSELHRVKECVENYSKGSMCDLISYLFKRVPVNGVPVHGYWVHIVTEKDYQEVLNDTE
jgi:NDP-sugar pyrophosphorylase family protein